MKSLRVVTILLSFIIKFGLASICPNDTSKTQTISSIEYNYSGFTGGWLAKVEECFTKDCFYYMGSVVYPDDYTLLKKVNTAGSDIWAKIYSGDPAKESFIIDNTQSMIYFISIETTKLQIMSASTSDGSLSYAIRSPSTIFCSMQYCRLLLNSDGSMLYIFTNGAGFTGSICRYSSTTNGFECYSTSGVMCASSALNIQNEEFFISALDNVTLMKVGFLRVNLASSTSIWAKFQSCQTSCPYGFHQSVFADDKSTIITLTQMDDLVFLAQLSTSTGVYLGSRYVSASTSQYALFMKYINKSVYFGMIYNSIFKLIIQSTQDSSFTIYQFSTGIKIYDFIFSATNNKIILVGSASTDANIYKAEAPFKVLNSNPNITDYSSAVMNTLASIDYTYVDSAGSTLTNTNYTAISYTPPTSSLNFVLIANYYSDTSYWLDDITISNVLSNSQLNVSEYFFCSLTGTTTQTCIFSIIQGNQIPSWISVDLPNNQFVINAPNITANTNYTFTIEQTTSENGNKYYRNVNVQVVICAIANCIQCKRGTTITCSICATGYMVNQTTGQCYEIDNSQYNSETVAASSAANQAIMGVGITSMAATSLFSLSSPQGMWSCFNEFQLLMLLLLTGAYFPQEIVKFLGGMDFTSFSFNFIPSLNILDSISLSSWADFELNNDYLEAIGMNSESTFTNNISFFCVLLLIIILHILYLIFYKILQKALSNKPKILKILAFVINFLTFNIYVRIMLESSQFMMISSSYEIKNFNINNKARRVSLSFAFLIFTVCLLFICFTGFQTIYYIKMPSNESYYFNEFFEGMKSTKKAKCYSLFIMIRRGIFICFLMFASDLNIIPTVGILVLLEVIYITILFLMRPFESVKNNFIEILNEIVFLGLACTLFYYNIKPRWNNVMILAFIFTVTINNLISAVIHIVLLIIMITKLTIKCFTKNKTQNKSNSNEQAEKSEIKLQNSSYIMERKIASSINSELPALNNKENIDFYMRPTHDKPQLSHKIETIKYTQRFETVQKQTKNFQSLISPKYLASVKPSAVSSMRSNPIVQNSNFVRNFIKNEENIQYLDPLGHFYNKKYEKFCRKSIDQS